MAIAGVPGPGAEAGNPWGGWSRGFLEKAGGVLDLEPEDIYLATALRCPVEQASLPDLRRCVPYMAEEISILAPRLILASGKVAAVALRMALGARCPERPKAGDVAKSASGRILFDLDIARTAGDENARRIFWEILGTGRDLL
jgi:uracil-DNA glycosylase